MLARIATLIIVPFLSIIGQEVWTLTSHLRFRSAPPSPFETMRAVRYSRHGRPRDVLEVVSNAPRPLTPAGPNMLVVRVAGAAINPVDFKMQRNDQPDALIPKPKIPGCDISGTVVDAGAGVHGFVVGDEVFGMLPIVGSRWGSLAEYVVAEASCFAKAPKSIPLVDAAALPLVGLTVMQVCEQAGLVKSATRQSGTSALVQAASGGVGTFAVQYLSNVLKFGQIIGTASSANAHFLSSLGVTRAIDYHSEDFESVTEQAGGVDVVIDPMAWKYMNRTLGGATKMLRKGAKYCHIMSSDWAPNAAESDPLTALQGPLMKWRSRIAHILNPSTPQIFSSAVQPDGASLATLASYVDAGMISPVIDKVFDGLDSAVEALEYLEDGHARGKVLVRL